MNERVVRIACAGDVLMAILHPALPSGVRGPNHGVLILVGGPQYRVGSHRQFILAARHLSATGIPVLRFDFRGMGDSSGSSPGFEHVAEDVRAAIDAMFRELPELESVSLFGLCDAASAALLHGTNDSRITSLVLANPWVRTESGQAAAFVKHYYGHRLLQGEFWRKLLRGGSNPLAMVGGFLAAMRASTRRAVPPQNFIERMLQGLSDFRGPILLISSGRDLTAREFDDLCQADSRWSAAMKEARVQRLDLPDTDHTFSDRAGLNAAHAAICEFLTRTRNPRRNGCTLQDARSLDSDRWPPTG